MAYYVGLDVSVKETSVCVMDDKGGVVARTDISKDPDLITNFISNHAPNVERVVQGAQEGCRGRLSKNCGHPALPLAKRNCV